MIDITLPCLALLVIVVLLAVVDRLAARRVKTTWIEPEKDE